MADIAGMRAGTASPNAVIQKAPDDADPGSLIDR